MLVRADLLIACTLMLLAGCADRTFTMIANSDPSRVVPIRRLAIVARQDPANAYKPNVQGRMPPMLRSCGIDTVVDVRDAVPILSSSLVEPPPNAQADAILVLDAINNPIDPRRPPSYALRLRRPDGQTIWRAVAEQDPAFGVSRINLEIVLGRDIINRMVSDKVLPSDCRQPAL